MVWLALVISAGALLALAAPIVDRLRFERLHPLPRLNRLQLAQPPFKVEPLPAGGLNMVRQRAGQWAEAVAPDGTRYVACTQRWLISPEDVFVCIGHGADGTFDQVLATGLRDTRPRSVELAVPDDTSAERPLGLKLNLPAVAIEHYSGNQLVTTTLQLADLERDSDGDGLTDVLEGMLYTDPHTADTDGDGIPDGVDPAPNENPRRAGALERGAARTMIFPDESAGRRLPPEATPPCSARYVFTDGCGPVPYAAPGERWIYLSSQDQQDYDQRGGCNATVIKVDLRLSSISESTGADGSEYLIDSFRGEYFPVKLLSASAP